MRVLNDNGEKAQPQELSFFSILSHAFMSALGIASVLLSPLPMVVAHFRLTDPWPKIAALVGAVFALMSFLQVPLPLTVIGFVFGLVVADLVARELAFPKLLAAAVGVAIITGIGSLYLGAQLESMTILAYWHHLIQVWVTTVREHFQTDPAMTVEKLKLNFSRQGPFLFVSGAILSVWLTLGISAHMGWTPEGHKFDRSHLRRIRFSIWWNVAFFISIAGALLGGPQIAYLFEGAFRILGALMFIQGCIQLSNLFKKRGVRTAARTFLYTIGATLGFYVLVGLGAMAPWIKRLPKTRLTPKTRLMEEA